MRGLKWAIISIVFLLAVSFFIVVYNTSGSGNQTNTTNTTACTMEAKICPDGSSVGRTLPNCDFAPCPTEPGLKTWTSEYLPNYNDWARWWTIDYQTANDSSLETQDAYMRVVMWVKYRIENQNFCTFIDGTTGAQHTGNCNAKLIKIEINYMGGWAWQLKAEYDMGAAISVSQEDNLVSQIQSDLVSSINGFTVTNWGKYTAYYPHLCILPRMINITQSELDRQCPA